MRASTALRITGWVLTIIAILVIGSVLVSGLGTLVSFRINQENVGMEPVSNNTISIEIPYSTKNPGPFDISPLTVTLQLMDKKGEPLSLPSSYTVKIPAGSRVSDVIKIPVTLKNMTLVEFALRSGELKPRLHVTVDGIIGGLTKFDIRVTQPLLGGG